MKPDRIGSADELQAVSPALAHYRDGTVDELWRRPGLSMRDRSIVTVSALIARNLTVELTDYMERALDSGVRAAELSEIITHLAFYSGWSNAMAAVQAAKVVFTRRHIDENQLPPVTGERLPLDDAAEEQRKAQVEQNFGAVAPGVLVFTTDLLFRDLWLRAGLAARDRSLVTVSALVASGQAAQITYHLGRAMDNGLTQTEASEALTQLAFYTGWPNVFTALPVVKEVFAARPDSTDH
jgi:4-carboxymuconolactone decarboxylase